MWSRRLRRWNSLPILIGCVACAVAQLLSGAARADSITYNATSLNLVEVSSASGELLVPKWNPAAYPGQVLNSIEIVLQASVNPKYGMKVYAYPVGPNIGAPPAVDTALIPITYGTYANVTLQLPGSAAVLHDDLFSVSSITRQGFSARSEYWDLHSLAFLGGTAAGSASQINTSPADLSRFVGYGIIRMPVIAGGGITIMPPDSPLGYAVLVEQYFPVSGFGSVSAAVTYNWTAVPEPTTFTLLSAGLVSLGWAGWRRRRNQRTVPEKWSDGVVGR
jgi:PEP-CTERM motif